MKDWDESFYIEIPIMHILGKLVGDEPLILMGEVGGVVMLGFILIIIMIYYGRVMIEWVSLVGDFMKGIL